MTPTPVTIVRPDSGLVDFFVQTTTYFVRAWVAMLALGGLFPHAHIAYWQVLLGLLVIGSTLNDTSYLFFSRAPKKGERL